MAAPLDHPEFSRWREQSVAARETAELARAGDRHDWACFLYEQAAQLALKGLLHGAGLDAWGHDVTVLAARAAANLGAGWDVGEASARLSRHYIAARYPDAHAGGAPAAHYTAADSTQAAADADEVVAAVDRAWQELRGSP
ncbi:MAG: HEPN domain-containing protein [Actinomycetota bacterium]